MDLRFSDLFYTYKHPFVPPPEFYQDFRKPRGIILNGVSYESVFLQQFMFFGSKERTSCSMCPTPEITSSWNLPCICPIINSRSNRSVPASTSSRAVLHDRNIDDSDVNQSVPVWGIISARAQVTAAFRTCPVGCGVFQRGSPSPGWWVT